MSYSSDRHSNDIVRNMLRDEEEREKARLEARAARELQRGPVGLHLPFSRNRAERRRKK